MSRAVASLYPAPPERVPDDLTEPTDAYRLHAWIAMAGLLAFVALYFGLTAWFGLATVSLILHGVSGAPDAWLGFLGALLPGFLCLFLLKGLFFIKRSGDPSLMELTEEQEPALFKFVHHVAADTGAPLPHRVFISPAVNAAVFYDLSLGNLLVPSRKNLLVGLGLLNVLTLDEFKAVLAHEFGHFAQRTMAVGRWVYTAQQVAGHIVATRGVFDRILDVVGRIDLRIAWIAWLMKLVVWSIRAVLDTAFRGIVLAERALSREMEFQADLVAVSVTGSDSLTHALHKLPAADDALDQAIQICLGSMNEEAPQPPDDLFRLQTHVIERLRSVLDDEQICQPPPVPEEGRAEHRVFGNKLAQPPRMWSTHPPNRDREDNAKERYLPSVLDDRPATVLLKDGDALRRKVSRGLFEQIEEANPGQKRLGPSTDCEDALHAADLRFDRPALARRFRGAYLGRSPVAGRDTAAELYGDVDAAAADADALRARLTGLYPESLSEELERARDLHEERALLQALQDGVLAAPGGIIQYRGEEVPRRRLADLVEGVEQEGRLADEAVMARDLEVRTTHRAAARLAGDGWEDHLVGLLSLLHYTEHTAADLQDAEGAMENVFQIVIADGRVSKSERQRLVHACEDVYRAITDIFSDRPRVRLPDDVADLLEVVGWTEAMPDSLELSAPNEHNLSDWLDVHMSWVRVLLGLLTVTSRRALEALVAAEDHVRGCFIDGSEPGEAPRAAQVPTRYTTRRPGTERERQKKLGLWDRFVLADGWLPGAARLTVATAILAPALVLSLVMVLDIIGVAF